ncbi:MAG: sigma-70 family RNA polymerase sigma factor [Bacillota bacterium]|nr:sigma-70 family RNA polymerase sigma factor [Bacillota bacterium]MDW7685252.1 sigma-70 family RNA polymerase sigma factor [Bacillota bacterium]
MTEEQRLIVQARGGDEAAMEALFHRHVARSVRLAYLICGDWGLAEDAVQDAFVNAFRALRTFRDDASFAPWFTRIVVNQAKNKNRRTKRFLPLTLAETAEAGCSTEDEVLDRERDAQVLQAINSLDEKHRLPVLLKYISGYTEAETAAVLRLPISTVKSRLHTARGRLKRSLADLKGGLTDEYTR